MIDGMNGLMGLEKQMGECLNNGERGERQCWNYARSSIKENILSLP